MKTKEIYLVVAASMMVVVGWAAWRFAAIPSVVDPPANTSLSAQQTTPVTQATPATSSRTGRPIVSEVIETPEMKKARFSAEMSRFQARADAQKADFAAQKADPKAYNKALKDRRKPEDMAFLKSLGLSDELRDKVYQMLRTKGDLYSDHQERMSEARRRGEIYTAFGRELRQMDADLEAAVGTENSHKIKYREDTLLERYQTAEFQRYLQSRSLPLTEEQQGAVVDAMYQARDGRIGSSPLMSPGISTEDKLAYIDRVKQSLTAGLNANDVALLEQHLKEIVEAPLKRKALEESLQKRGAEIRKTIEDKKMKLPNPPAAPR